MIKSTSDIKIRSDFRRLTNPERQYQSDVSLSTTSHMAPNFSNSGNALSSSPDLLLKKSQLKLELATIKDSPTANYFSRLQSVLGRYSPCGMGKNSVSNSFLDGDVNSPTDKSISSPTSPRNVNLKPLNSLTNYVSKAGFKIKGGVLSCGKKIRACNSIVKANLQNTKGMFLFAVCEGRGPFGPQISSYISLNYANVLEMHIPRDVKPNKILSALSTADEKLMENLKASSQEVNFSGCSLLTTIVCGENLLVSNVGDSQAVICKYKDEWTGHALCKAHNLNNPEEKTRILEFGGKIQTVESLENNRQCSEKFYGGAARGYGFEQTRSIGFNSGKSIGIISKPETSLYKLKSEDKFVIIANSNFWSVIDYSEAAEIAAEGWALKKTDFSCEKLIKKAQARLKGSHNSSDEISVLIFFFNHLA